VPATPRRRAPEPAGIRWIQGRLVIGMTVDELAMLRQRIDALLAAVDRGDPKQF